MSYSTRTVTTADIEENPFPKVSRLFQIFAAHRSAQPKDSNPAWMNTHRDLDAVLCELVSARAALSDALHSAKHLESCGLHNRDGQPITADHTITTLERGLAFGYEVE